MKTEHRFKFDIVCFIRKRGTIENTDECLSISSELIYKAAKTAAPRIPAKTAWKPTWREAMAEGVGLATVSDGVGWLAVVSWVAEVVVLRAEVDSVAMVVVMAEDGTSVEAPEVGTSAEEVGTPVEPVGTAVVTSGTEALAEVADGTGTEADGVGAGPQSVMVTVTVMAPSIPVSMAFYGRVFLSILRKGNPNQTYHHVRLFC